MRVLVAGASGLVGFEVAQILNEQGVALRTLSKSAVNAEKLRALTDDVRLGDATVAESLVGVCDGVDAVCSSLGASVGMTSGDRRGFFAVDLVANRNLLAEAVRAGVKRFVYVAVHVESGYASTEYVRAHEAFVQELKASGLDWAVVRPTGIFGALTELVEMARRGPLPVIGGGAARTNPVHERDVAEVCVGALMSSERSLDLSCGGPGIWTRREIATMAFNALQRRPRLMAVPAFIMRLAAKLLRLFDRRRGEFFAFAVEVSVTDCVAPLVGKRSLKQRFEEVAARQV